jgi:hypothetical protein
MTEITHCRLLNQRIAVPDCRKAEEVVAALGAMQAQDYTGALWSVGLRLPDATEASVENAIAERKIVRTWPMRGTLHLVAASDVHWMLDLLTPRIITRAARRERELKLDAATFVRCEKLFVRELRGQRQLSRPTLMKLLEQNNISTANQRGYQILLHLAMEKLICFGPRMGKQHTFALLDEWIPAGKKLDRDAALAEIAFRYFTSHGPATLPDFATWTGLGADDARAGLDSVASRLAPKKVGGKDYWMSRAVANKLRTAPDAAFLLPGFDEYLLGYKDRSAVLDPQHTQKVVPVGNGRFLPTIILDGRVAGTWQRTIGKREVSLKLDPFKRLTGIQKQAIGVAAGRYGQFLGLSVELPD